MNERKFVNTFSTLLLTASGLFAAAGASAAVVETTYADWDIFGPSGTAPNFEVRYGDGSSAGGAWETGVKDGPTLAGATNHLDWNNDSIALSFSLTHSSVTGDLVFTMGGNSITWDLAPGESYGEISILAKSADTAGLVTTISNLELDTVALTNATLIATQAQRTGVNLSGEFFSDFTLTGELDLAWSGAAPNPADLQMFVGVDSAIPIPATVWLFGSALAGLGWLRRKHTV